MIPYFVFYPYLITKGLKSPQQPASPELQPKENIAHRIFVPEAQDMGRKMDSFQTCALEISMFKFF
jgi:hypothetical protein